MLGSSILGWSILTLHPNGLYSESGMKFSCEMMLSNSLLLISSPWFCHHCLGKYIMLYGFVAASL
jgi:hypothetical protein